VAGASVDVVFVAFAAATVVRERALPESVFLEGAFLETVRLATAFLVAVAFSAAGFLTRARAVAAGDPADFVVRFTAI